MNYRTTLPNGGYAPANAKIERCELVSVRRCGPQSATDRPYSRHRAEMDVNQSFHQLINHNHTLKRGWHKVCSLKTLFIKPPSHAVELGNPVHQLAKN